MSSIYENLSVEELINISLEREEGEIASNGALKATADIYHQLD